MNRYALLALAFLMPATAFAASANQTGGDISGTMLSSKVDAPEAPVNRVISVARLRWETTEGASADYFDNLDLDFSKSFAATYRENTKYPAYDEGDTPFDYDVITSSQDGCPLKDIKVGPVTEENGATVVDASFKLWMCAPDAESQIKVNELKFDIAIEDGRPVINDVHRLSEGKWDSLVAEMKENIERGKNPQ